MKAIIDQLFGTDAKKAEAASKALNSRGATTGADANTILDALAQEVRPLKGVYLKPKHDLLAAIQDCESEAARAVFREKGPQAIIAAYPTLEEDEESAHHQPEAPAPLTFPPELDPILVLPSAWPGRTSPASSGPGLAGCGSVPVVSSSATSLPPTSHDLAVPDTRPYFLWWTDMTVGDLRRMLDSEDLEERAYWMGALLREANTRDVWLFVQPSDIRAQWPRLIRYLGRSRMMWAYLLGMEAPAWPPPEARGA